MKNFFGMQGIVFVEKYDEKQGVKFYKRVLVLKK